VPVGAVKTAQRSAVAMPGILRDQMFPPKGIVYKEQAQALVVHEPKVITYKEPAFAAESAPKTTDVNELKQSYKLPVGVSYS
jgi:hypothetical protein